MRKLLTITCLMVIVLALGAVNTQAATCTIPFTFVNNTQIADANQVNANFSAVNTCVNNILSGASPISGSLTVNNNITAGGTITGAGLSISGSATLGALTVSGTSTFNGATTFSAPLILPNAVSVASTLTINSGNQSTYCGTTINANSGFFTITLAAASGFTGPCQITINDNDSRGKTLAVNGLPNRILWPTTTITYKIIGSAWVVTQEPLRWKVDCSNSLTSSLCPQSGSGYSVFLYVDATSGNNANDCLTTGSGACATMSQARQNLYTYMDLGNGGYPVLDLTNGTLTDSVNFQGSAPNAAVVFILCQAGTLWQPGGSGVALEVGDGAVVEVGLNGGGQACHWDATGFGGQNFAIFVHQTSIVDVNSGANYGNFPGGADTFVDKTGDLNFNLGYTISGSSPNHVLLGPGAQLTSSGAITITFSASPTFTSLYQASGAGATISIGGSTTYSGAATISNACALTGLVVVSLNANTIPGTNNCAAGISHGAQVF